MLDLVSGIQAAIIGQCIVIILFILSATPELSRSDKALIALLVVISCHMGINILLIVTSAHLLSALSIGLSLSYGPLIYRYVLACLYKNDQSRIHFRLHFLLPVLLFTAHLLLGVSTLLAACFTFLTMAMYLTASLKMYNKYRAAIALTQSLQNSIAMKGIKLVLVLNLVILLVNIFAVTVSVISNNQAIASLVNIVLFLVLSSSILPTVFTSTFSALAFTIRFNSS